MLGNKRNDFDFQFDKVRHQLKEYHQCVKFFNQGSMALAEAFTKVGLRLEYAGRWVHRDGIRIGVLFTEVEKGEQRYISVPIHVFVSKRYDDFVKKYCKIGSDE
jgi:hypothetical protein